MQRPIILVMLRSGLEGGVGKGLTLATVVDSRSRRYRNTSA